MENLTLEDILNKNGSDKGTKNRVKHSYANFYDQFLREKREDNLIILEIGIDSGCSIKSWYEYCPNSVIIGLDIDDKSFLNNDRIYTYKLDQSNKNELENFANECVKNNYTFDFILDDGSHHMYDQQITLGYLFPLLKSKGVYFLEDLHTSLADNGYPLYRNYLDIKEYRHNTTLFYLMESLHSGYCTPEQNNYLSNNIDVIEIHNKFNPYQEPQYKYRSITSAIIKK
jgi:hypothetical protein